MARSISSAEPEKLFRYSDFGMQLDHELVSESYRLASRLQHFEATCTEPGYRVSVGHLPGELRGHGGRSETIDSWVRQVGEGFRAADQMWIGVPRVPGWPTASIPEAPIWRIRIPWLRVLPFPRIGVPIRILPVLPPVLEVPGWLVIILPVLPWIKRRFGRVPAAPWDRQKPGRVVPEPAPTPVPTPSPLDSDQDQAAQEPDRIRSIQDAEEYHICQFEAELLVGGDGKTANCGPASLAIALHTLGLEVEGEDENTRKGEVVDLARKSMVTDPARDGVDEKGNRVEAEHSTFTYLSELERGAKAAGARAKPITADASSIQRAIEGGGAVIVSGTVESINSVPLTVQNYRTPWVRWGIP